MLDISITLKAEDSFLRALNAFAQVFTPVESKCVEQPKQAIATAPVIPVTPSIPQPATIPAAPVTPSIPQQAPIPTAPVVPPAEYTLEQLSYAAAPLMDAGKMAELLAVMQKFGVRSLQELPKEKYGMFATEIRTLGAKI
ncbi:MAG: hypothetical protein VB119_07145 [Candidatus Metalachnospira sp.]|nr:hypothetical protein [Candidatus Metalachnospira sp.]